MSSDGELQVGERGSEHLDGIHHNLAPGQKQGRPGLLDASNTNERVDDINTNGYVLLTPFASGYERTCAAGECLVRI